MTKPTDKELIDLAERGVFCKQVRTSAIKAFYTTKLQSMPTIKDAVSATAIKFDIDESTVRRTVNK